MTSEGPYRTSLDSPLRVDFLPPELTKLPVGIGMTLAPGKKGAGLDGLWARDLTVDLACLRDTFGAKHVVTLMELDELHDLSKSASSKPSRGTSTALHREVVVSSKTEESWTRLRKVTRAEEAASWQRSSTERR